MIKKPKGKDLKASKNSLPQPSPCFRPFQEKQQKSFLHRCATVMYCNLLAKG
jgi:hypothetical protein